MEPAKSAAPVAASSMQNLRVREQDKTPEQRAEDIAYTINHAVSCATTDLFIVPGIAGMFGAHDHHDGGNFLQRVRHEWGHYLGGEIIGDFSAVPLTIMVQRFFPAFMESVARIVEPVAKPFFQHGARTAAERWGRKHGLAASDTEVVDRAQEIFQHEMQHLPQAVVWNMFSFPLGVIGQSIGQQFGNGAHGHGHGGNWKTITKNKLLGTAISNILLIGGRALLPDKAEKFDRLDGKYIIRPTTRALSGLFGIDSKVVDRMDQKAEAEEQRENGTWRRRVRDSANDATIAAQHGIS